MPSAPEGRSRKCRLTCCEERALQRAGGHRGGSRPHGGGPTVHSGGDRGDARAGRRRGFLKDGLLPRPGGSIGRSVVPTPQGCGVTSQSGHIPKLPVRSPGREPRQPVDVSLPLLPSPANISKNLSWVRIEKREAACFPGSAGQQPGQFRFGNQRRWAVVLPGRSERAERRGGIPRQCTPTGGAHGRSVVRNAVRPVGGSALSVA